jgi:hypothetical protein
VHVVGFSDGDITACLIARASATKIARSDDDLTSQETSMALSNQVNGSLWSHTAFLAHTLWSDRPQSSMAALSQFLG